MSKIICPLLVILTSQICGQNYKQSQIDSLAAVTHQLTDDTVKCINYSLISNFYLYANTSKGLFYADKEIALAEKLNWNKGIGQGHLDMAKHLISSGSHAEALNNLTIAEQTFTNSGDRYNLGNTYNQIGILKANQSKFPEALHFFFNSAKEFEKLKDLRAIIKAGYAFRNVANVYTATENFDKAIQNYDEAISIFKKVGQEEIEIAMNTASKGLVYQKQYKNKQALDALKTAESILIKKNASINLAFINSWLGSVYLSLGDYNMSLQYSNKALKTIQTIGDEVLTASTMQNISYAHLKKGKQLNNQQELEQAFEGLSKSLLMNKKLGNIELLINDYRYLSEYFEFKKEFENSLEAFKKYTVFNDSIFNTKNKQSLQNQQDERTIELRDKEIELNKITLQNKEIQKWFLIASIGLFGIIGILLFYQNRIRKKTNQKLHILNSELDQANKTKIQFFSILNHDLRSPVAGLIHFLHLKKNSPELLDQETELRMENKTIKSAENLLQSMEDILFWSKGQMDNFKPVSKTLSVSAIFDDTRQHFSNIEKIEIVIENSDHIYITTDENYLKTIVRNLVSNAVTALNNQQNAQIILKAWQANTQQFISVRDNGSGATQDKFKALYDDKEVVGIKTGLGLHLIRDLAKAINCQINVQSNPEKGTIFTLIFNV